MILVGVLLSVGAIGALASLTVIVDAAIRRSADPIDLAVHRVLPFQSQYIDQKFAPPWVKVLSALLVVALACGIALTGVGLFRASNSLLWRGAMVYMALGLLLGLRHISTGRRGSLGRFPTLFAFTLLWPFLIFSRR